MILDEGRVEGKIEGEVSLLLLQGRRRFGRISAKAESALKSINDIARLERMAEAILTAKSWSELLAIQ